MPPSNLDYAKLQARGRVGGLPQSRPRGPTLQACVPPFRFQNSRMLLFPEKVPADWLPKVLANAPAVLIDHAHLERKAATSALNLEKYRDLYLRVGELNAIAIEELQHFQLVLDLLKQRGIPFSQPHASPSWKCCSS